MRLHAALELSSFSDRTRRGSLLPKSMTETEHQYSQLKWRLLPWSGHVRSSHAPLPTSEDPGFIERFVETVMSALPASTNRLQEYRTAQLTDLDCAQLIQLF